ncbi:MAG: transglutaminase-like cysteine peptidase [Beijerinckiaceae bacterium]
MAGIGFKGLAIAALLGLGVFATQSPTEARGMRSSFIGVGGQTLVPYGWVDFCNRYGNECRTRPMAAQDVRYSPASHKLMVRINDWVNKSIKPKSDEEHWRKVDRWDYPSDGYGDCEDYVLLKRKLLMDEGFPRQALLITVVKDQRGDGHAVLTVKTTEGEFILDNLNPEVKPWKKVPYRFVKRQSQADPNAWVEIGEPTSAPLVVSR